MRTLVSAVAIVLLAGPPATAQVPDIKELSARGFIPDLVVPDAPAFEMLASQPTTILRPNAVQDIAVMLSEFQDADGSFRLPASFGVEFAPGLLIAGGDLSKQSYEQAKIMTALRLSFGVLTDTATDGVSRLAAGIRYTARNEADLRSDADFVADLQVTPLTAQILDIYLAARRRIGPNVDIVLSPAEERQVEEIQELIRERWAARYWNASGVDFALAFRGSTLDARGTDPRVTGYGAWGTYAARVGDWGQFVIGARAGGEREREADDFTQLLALGFRLNAGTNEYKFFSSFENAFRESEDAQMRGNIGIELNLADWIWGEFALGIRDEEGVDRTEATFKLKTAFPRI